jgi:hypothetical protein
MYFVAKAFMVALVALAFVAPLVMTEHCESDQAAECAPECVCACHAAPAFTCLTQASGLRARRAERAHSIDMLFLERLSIADIYRPPISA